MSEPLCIHAYRDQKILCTMIVLPHAEKGYIIYREDDPEAWRTARVVATEDEAMDHAESYIDGYMAGYDEGIAHASENAGKNFRDFGYYHRVTASEGQRRDRTDDSGSRESVGSD